jgi:hypothetical protein
MDSASFVSSLSQFTTAVHGFYNELVGIALVLCFAGLLIHVFKAQVAMDVRGLDASLVRLGIIAIAVGHLGTWGDLLISGVNSLVAESNGGSGINIMTAYQNAIARVLGSNAPSMQDCAVGKS